MPADTPAFLTERLKAEGEKTAAGFAGLTPEQWDLPVYADGQTWTVRSLLVHYVTAEREMLGLFADIRAGGTGAPEDFDVDRYNAIQQRRMARLSPNELLDQFAAVRAECIAYVSGLDTADLEKPGRHPFLGMTTLGEMIKLVYRHNQTHHRDIRRALSA
jgi:uncharacterized protein (TIGR03083 family)